MLGVAYEVGAILGRDVKWPTIEKQEATEKASDYLSVTCRSSRRQSIIYGKNR